MRRFPYSGLGAVLGLREEHQHTGVVLHGVGIDAGLLAPAVEGLVEEVNTQKEGYVTCRLSNNMIVHIPGDASLIGTYQQVLLEECKGFYYFGRIAGQN